MSARRLSDKFGLSANPSFLDFSNSDGNSTLWPTNTTRTVDHEGHVNFMQHIDLDNATVMKWRSLAGKAVALELGMPEGPDYVFRDWPQGYRMYDHHKGPAANPRHDVYLFGSPRGRFRSINEFIPHAIWLMRDQTVNPGGCFCKYCTKKAQKEITASMSNILRSTPGGSQSPAPSRLREKLARSRDLARERRLRETKIYAAVTKAPKPLKPSPHVSKHPMLVERNSDLRAIHSATHMKLKRWFRYGELLWCELDPQIAGPNGPTSNIRFWPGLVEEVRLKNQVTPQVVPDANGVQISIHENGDNDSGATHSSFHSTPLPPSPWTVQQSTTYKMKLLGVSCTYIVADNQVLPYQAHIPPNDLIVALQEFPPAELNFSREKLSNFNPCSGDRAPPFADAVAPYAMAVQIGATLSGYWCLTDEWDFKYTVPRPLTHQPLPRPSQPQTTLQSVIEAAALNNSINLTHKPNSNAFYRNVSSVVPNMPQPEVQAVVNNILGQPAQEQVNTQVRFQGLWWGAERIWTDEFVRLKNILPPSGPGKSARDTWIAQGRDPAELGAGSRGVFMRLDGLFVVDALQPDGGTRKECRASGMLYELADEDWEEVNASSGGATPAPIASSSLSGPVPVNGNAQAGPSSFPSQSAQPIPGPSNTTPATSSAGLPLPPREILSPTPYILPQAPEGYRFRAILPEGHESVISLSLISGRYYPRVLSHPLLDHTLRQALSNSPERGGLMEYNNLWALEGLAAGFYNSVDPTIYKTTRVKMVEDADKEAAAQLEQHRSERLKDEMEEQMVLDDVDEIVDDGSMDIDKPVLR
ncbi:hypothetical protein BD779DRAFT_1511858 [Infundibulicybe gibba]|nr:hypothetical protein BD779DRAFT_1511858 [Infundibulicybe gibba]